MHWQQTCKEYDCSGYCHVAKNVFFLSSISSYSSTCLYHVFVVALLVYWHIFWLECFLVDKEWLSNGNRMSSNEQLSLDCSNMFINLYLIKKFYWMKSILGMFVTQTTNWQAITCIQEGYIHRVKLANTYTLFPSDTSWDCQYTTQRNPSMPKGSHFQ